MHLSACRQKQRRLPHFVSLARSLRKAIEAATSSTARLHSAHIFCRFVTGCLADESLYKMLACSTAAGVHWAMECVRRRPPPRRLPHPVHDTVFCSWQVFRSSAFRLCISLKSYACIHCALVRIGSAILLLHLLQCFPLSMTCLRLSVCVPSSVCTNQHCSPSHALLASASVAARSTAARTSLPFLNSWTHRVIAVSIAQTKAKMKYFVFLVNILPLLFLRIHLCLRVCTYTSEFRHASP